jgi:hypothetical protein
MAVAAGNSSLLLGGHVAPMVLLGIGLVGGLSLLACGLVGCGVVASYYPRLRAVSRFGHPWESAVLHPLGILVLLVIQWYACLRALRGRPAIWKDRTYGVSTIGS